MNIKETVMRRIVWILTGLAVYALLSLVGIGKAHAQAGGCNATVAPNNAGSSHVTAAEAYSACMASGTGPQKYVLMMENQHATFTECKQQGTLYNFKRHYTVRYLNGSGVCTVSHNENFSGYTFQNYNCPQGQEWSSATNTCFAMPTQEQCLARNVDAQKPTVILFTGSDCIQNCKYAMLTPGTVTSVNPWTVSSGTTGYTGESCSTAPITPPIDPTKPPEQKCIPHGSLTMCVQPDGRHCYNATTGRQICWNPGETGEKTDGPIKQTVAPGTNTPVPSPPKPGDTQTPVGNPSTTTITKDGRTITTTVINNTTGSGSDAGPSNTGTPSTGTGTTPAPDPGDDEAPGTASGGATCGAPPACSGDAILCAINEQTWRARCATDDDTTAPLVGDGGTDEPASGVIEDGTEVGAEGLDNSGFGWVRACPASTDFQVFGQSYNFDSQGVLCNWLQIGGALMLLFGALAAFRILAGAV